MLCIGLNFFLWCFVTPYFFSPFKCSVVPYPKFLCQLYFGYLFESLIINKSLETLAIIEAAAKIMGTESYNGWTYWHCKVNGSFVPIDNLRQRFLSKNM